MLLKAVSKYVPLKDQASRHVPIPVFAVKQQCKSEWSSWKCDCPGKLWGHNISESMKILILEEMQCQLIQCHPPTLPRISLPILAIMCQSAILLQCSSKGEAQLKVSWLRHKISVLVLKVLPDGHHLPLLVNKIKSSWLRPNKEILAE